MVHIDTGLVPVNPDESFTAHSQAGQLEDLNSLVPVICDHAIKAEDTVSLRGWPI